MLRGMVGPRRLMPLSCALPSVETTDFVLRVFHHSKDVGATTPRPRLRARTSPPGNLPTPPAVLPVSVNPLPCGARDLYSCPRPHTAFPLWPGDPCGHMEGPLWLRSSPGGVGCVCGGFAFLASVPLLSRVRLFATPWTATCQASLSFTNSQSLLKLMSIESVMPSSHLILCRPLPLLPSIFPRIKVFLNELVICIRWPKYWSFSFSICPSSRYSGLISFRIIWFGLLMVQGTCLETSLFCFTLEDTLGIRLWGGRCALPPSPFR